MANSPCNPIPPPLPLRLPDRAQGACFVSRSPEETRALGRRIGAILPPGSIVALEGGLGAGKTCLAQGIARGLGVTEAVTSPTYPIIAEYAGRVPVYHIDAYRLSGDEEFAALGGHAYLEGNGVAVVEWSERLALPPGALRVAITLGSDGAERRITLPGSLAAAAGHDA